MLLENEPKTVRTVGELLKALKNVDPSTKLLISAWTYTDKVDRNETISIHTENRNKGCAIELDMFSWEENGEMVKPVLKISNDDPLEMVIG